MKKIDYDDPKSFALKARKARFKFFLEQLDKLNRPLKILDVGGTEKYWEMIDFLEHVDMETQGIEIYLLNLTHQKVTKPNFVSLKGTATNLSEYENGFFDLVFSNSVIEHLFTWENQLKMAKEVRRVGKSYFIQTPNFWFPIEPHYVMPLIQYFPKKVRTQLLLLFHSGYNDKNTAFQKVEEIRLLTIKQMKELFPDGKTYLEKFMGLNKSIIMYKIE
ncbi:methyltransferase domain-containing protein [Ulvibacterium sp.]|uniref:methyltransferase domain-containing protein n=1 Tax=Ulvibacterium sp. TaxID=2665914 RepID=UPI00262BA1E4|nr:methyltransferase domain-containing protein [Ulvibacterium sp.]